MLQIIISPAKQMDIRRDAFEARGIPPFPQQSARIIEALRDIERAQGPSGLKSLWAVSDKLLDENLARLHEFTSLQSSGHIQDAGIAARIGPALFSYVGIQYRSMAPEVLSEQALEWLQQHLWILSALYGCARPYDAVQPYRLEMAAKLKVNGANNLYEFWGGLIARTVCPTPDVEVVNLASAEYSKAVLPHLDDAARVATCVFSSSMRNGKPVQKSTESKTARGSMVRWMAETNASTIEDLMRFDVGFRFDPELSDTTSQNATLVFMKR